MPSADGQGDAGTPAGGMPSPGQGDALPGLDPSARDGGESGTNPAGGDSGAMPGSPAGGFDPASGGAGTLPGSPSGGDYTLDTLPGGGVFQGSAGAAGQPGGDGGGMTAAQRAAVLDEQLRRTYEVHDEVLRREQAEARGVGMPGGGNNGGPPPGGGGEGGAPQSGGPDGAGSPNGRGGPEPQAAALEFLGDQRREEAGPGHGADELLRVGPVAVDPLPVPAVEFPAQGLYRMPDIAEVL